MTHNLAIDLEKYPGEVLRLALISGHYRQSLNWTDESINQAHSMLNRIYRNLKKVEDVNIDNNVRCTISGRPRFISFSNPFIAPKCQELSRSVFEIFFLNFFEYDKTDE